MTLDVISPPDEHSDSWLSQRVSYSCMLLASGRSMCIQAWAYLRLWGGAVGAQLGTAFRSDCSGDGPNTCIHCKVEVPRRWEVCVSCHQLGRTLPKEPKRCAVCLSRVEQNCKTLPLRDPGEFLRILTSAEEGMQLVERVREYRDIVQCPVKAGERLCLKNDCAFALEKRFRTREKREVGRVLQETK